MNRGVARAKGDIIGILNADDAYADPHVIADILKTFETTGADAVYADLDYVDEATATVVTRHWKSGVPGNFRKGWMPPHPTLFVKREIYEQHGLFSLELRSAADYELMLRFFPFQRGTARLPPQNHSQDACRRTVQCVTHQQGKSKRRRRQSLANQWKRSPTALALGQASAQNQPVPKTLIPAANAISGCCSSGPLGRSSRRAGGSP